MRKFITITLLCIMSYLILAACSSANSNRDEITALGEVNSSNSSNNEIAEYVTSASSAPTRQTHETLSNQEGLM